MNLTESLNTRENPICLALRFWKSWKTNKTSRISCLAMPLPSISGRAHDSSEAFRNGTTNDQLLFLDSGCGVRIYCIWYQWISVRMWKITCDQNSWPTHEIAVQSSGIRINRLPVFLDATRYDQPYLNCITVKSVRYTVSLSCANVYHFTAIYWIRWTDWWHSSPALTNNNKYIQPDP